MKSLFIDCSNGVSGDMLLGGLIDLGVPYDVINKPLESLGFSEDYALKYEESKSFNLRGIKVSVEDRSSNQKHRKWIDIQKMIVSSGLNSILKDRVLKVFGILADAESFVHGIQKDEVHFHEIGAIDSLVDIIGVCAAVEYLNLKYIICDYPPAGSGFVNTSHGQLPVPVPAVVELAKTHNIKLFSNEHLCGELTTPTGLALLIALGDDFGKPPFFDIHSIGIGLGHREVNRPNFLRIFLLEGNIFSSNKNILEGPRWEEVVVQQAWVDDSSAEDLSHLSNQLRLFGAIEVISQSIQMKKGRLGLSITAISKANDKDKLRKAWLSFGSTIGVREHVEERWVLPRRLGKCSTIFGELSVKQVCRPDGKLTLKIEHDELSRISLERSVSLDCVRNEVAKSLETFLPDEEWTY